MPDMQFCMVCKKEFDFDKQGLSCGAVVVCGAICAKASAKSRGHKVAIHDKTGKTLETDADGTEVIHNW